MTETHVPNTADCLIDSFRDSPVPSAGFSAWFLGQNSFVLKAPGGYLVAIDPYLSDWCATRGKTREKTPRSRLFPPPIAPADLDVDLVLLTHSHCDHADPETLVALALNARVRVAGPRDAILVAAAAGFPADRLTTIHAGEELGFGRIGDDDSAVSVRATFALPTDGTDLNHLGFLIRFANGTTFWDTGDTAWCDGLPQLATAALGCRPDVMAVCINSGYGNLSHWDASRLVGAAAPRFAVPAHWDLFPHNSCDPTPFKTSLDKNAAGTAYARMDRNRRYDYSGDSFGPAAE